MTLLEELLTVALELVSVLLLELSSTMTTLMMLGSSVLELDDEFFCELELTAATLLELLSTMMTLILSGSSMELDELANAMPASKVSAKRNFCIRTPKCSTNTTQIL